MSKWKGEVASCAPNLAHLVPATMGRVSFGRLLAAAVVAGLVANPTAAADRYWDVNGTSPGSGGDGIWNLSNLYWSPNSSDTLGPYNEPWDNGALDHAIFSGTAGTVTLGSAITANALTFNTSGYTISGTGANILTLAGTTPTITVNSGTSTISAIIAGSAGLAKAGAGGLVLNGANTFTGGVTVNAGTLSVASDTALGDAANTITLNAGTTFSAGGDLSSRTVILAGDVTFGAQAGSALITGTGNVSVASGGVMNNDASDYVGDTTFGAHAFWGSRTFTSVRNDGEASSLGSSGDIIMASSQQGAEVVTYQGSGNTSNRTFRLNAINHVMSFVNGGTGTLALTGSIVLEGNNQSSFNASSADFALTGTISALGTGGIGFSGGAGRSVTLGGNNSYSGSTTISTTVVAPTLANIGTNSSFGTGNSDSQIHVNNGALSYTGGVASSDRTWLFSNSANLRNDGSGGLTLTGAAQFNAGAALDVLTFSGSFAGENTLSGALTGSGSVVMNGSGTWVLSGANTYTGTTTVQSGTLRAGSATAFGSSTSAIVNGGTLDLNGFDLSLTSLTGTGGTLALGAADLTLTLATGVTNTFAGGITGSGTLTKLGAGTLTLSGASTYSGDTSIGGGTLALNFAAAAAPADDIISSASTLNMGGGTVQLTGAASEANSQTFDGLNVTAGSNRITATAGTGGTMTVNYGAVTRTGGQIDFGIGSGVTMTVAPGTTLGGWATVNGSDYADVNASNQIVAFTDYDLKDDAGNWIDGDIVTDTGGAANTQFTGTVSDSGGDNIVQLGGLRYTVARNSAVTVGTGQTLGVDGTIIIASTVASTTQTISGGSMRGASGGVLGIQQNSGGTFTINSTIVDNGGATGLTVGGTGSGSVVLGNAANTYSGPTWITRAKLAVGTLANGGAASSIGDSSAASSNLVLEGGTLSYTGGNVTTDRGFTLMRAGAITGGTIEVTQTATNLTFGGEVVSPDGAGLTKTGAGTLTLTNANSSYTGATVISAGTLAVSSLGNGGANSTIGASTGDSANLVIGNGAAFKYDGATASSDRGFTLGTGTGSATFNVSSAGTTLTMSGNAVGSNNLIKDGAGVLVLAGNNTYNSNTVRAGTLRAGSTTAFGRDVGLMNVDSGARLELGTFSNVIGGLNGAGTVDLGASGTRLTLYTRTAAFTGTITGAGELAVTGEAVQTLNGCNHTYTGATVISNGTLITDCIRNGNAASGIGASPAPASNLVLATNGVLQYTGGSVTTDRGFHLQAGWGVINVTQPGTNLQFAGNVTSGTGSLDKSGPGTLTLSGTNTYNDTVVRGGTLVAGSAQALGSGVLYIQTGATVDMTGFANTVTSLSDNGTTGGEILIGSRTLTLSGGNAAFAGRVTGTTGRLVKNGGGTQTLSGCDNNYGGSTTINGGWIAVACLTNGGVNSSIGSSSADAGNLVIGGTNSAGLSYIGTGGSTDRRFTMGNTAYIRNNGTGAINFTNTAAIAQTGTGARQLRLGGTNTGTNILAAQIVDNGASAVSLVKEEAGTWRLTSTTSNFTGGTTISPDGVLEVVKLANGGGASSIGASSAAASSLVINTNARLRYVGTGDSTNRLFTLGTGTTLMESSGTGAINFTDSGGLMGFAGTGARTFTLGGTYTGDNIMGVTIRDQSGTAQTSLAKNDSGTWILTANNTYTGNTVINDGKLIVGNGGTSGNVGTGQVILAFSTGTLGFNRSDTINFAGQISGPGIIEQMGPGTTTLTAVNSAGTTRIGAGALQVNGSLTTTTLAMTGTSALTVNGTVGAASGNPSILTGDAGASTITVASGGALTAAGDLGAGADVVTLAGTLNTGAGRVNLGDGADTLTLNDGGVLSGAGINAGAGTDTLHVNNAVARTIDGLNVTGFESLNKQMAGLLTLTGNHSYTAGTTVGAGELRVGAGGASGSLVGNVNNNGTLSFNRSDNYTFAGLVSGTGGVTQLGAGITTLTGTNTYQGATNVQTGTLLINGNQSGATGLTTVGTGGTLGGTGVIGGSVSVASGGALNPGDGGLSAGTLAINGGLTLAGGSTLNINFGRPNTVGGSLNDLITVAGNLVLDGNLNVTQTPGGTFGPGLYRIISYSGALTNNGLDESSPDFFVQTSIANQVNLVNTGSLQLNYWDGDAGPKHNSVVNGGSGTWRAADDNWTSDTGVVNAAWTSGGFAIFAGAAGTVTVDDVDGGVAASGMQFATSGYLVQGDDIALVGPQSTIRVGDGTATGASYVATITANLTGGTQLVKADFGTLVLSGTNTYTGGTLVDDGVLQISADANLGDAAGAVTIDGATLRNTAAISNARSVTLGAGGGTFDTVADLTLNGTIGGAGALTKTGAGTLVLTGLNTYAGGTVIDDGTIVISADANLGNAAGALTIDGGTLRNTGVISSARTVTLNSGGGTFDTVADLTLSGVIAGTGALTKTGAGTLMLTGANTYAGGTTISGGMLQLGNGGAAGSILGNVVNNGTFAFNRNDSYTFAGLISGTGALEQLGSGTTVLAAANSYLGATDVREGTLIVNGDQSGSTGTTTVEDGGILGGIGTIGGDVAVLDNGRLAPGDLGVAPGELTINGNLVLGSLAELDYNFGQANVVGGPFNDLTTVDGDLTLDGSINVAETPGGTFGPGIYRVISYGGTLTDLGLASNSPDYTVQTSVLQQVNLINTAGLTLNFWDGPDADVTPGDGVIQGGDGVWRLSDNVHWTNEAGTVNASYSNATFAIFAGAAGTVTVDNANGQIEVAGMQFAVDGYAIDGDPLTMVGPETIVRVGDGTADGEGYVATIDSVLQGDTKLVKTDLGTLVLTGDNTYTGDTTISHGTLQIGDGGTTGTVLGDIENNSVLTFNRSDRVVFDGLITGTGVVNQIGTLDIVLTADNTYTGGTVIANGSLQLGNGGVTGSIVGDVMNNGELIFNRSDAVTFSGLISGTGSVTQAGPGVTVLTADQTYTGGTTITSGMLQIGNGGTSGSILGDVVNDGTLAFNRSGDLSFAGVISGTGTIRQIGSGRMELTGDSSGFAGTTSVEAGVLAVNGSLCGDVNVLAGARLQGTGVLCDTNNAGAIAPGNSIGTITVDGDYVGNGGTIEIETELGGDTSPTDRLVVTGNTSGTTNVRVLNLGGGGARTVEGIKIIDIGGASDGTFTLIGDYVLDGRQVVVAGAYGYGLEKNGVSTPNDGDWYLRSAQLTPDDPDPVYAPSVPLYEAYAGVLQSFTELGTLQQRVGNRSWSGTAPGRAGGSPIWGRIEASHASVDPERTTTGTDYDVTTWKLQAGMDGLLHESGAGVLMGGVNVHYGTIASSVSSIFGAGSIDATGYGLGGTLTWLGNDGLYVDAQAQATWYDASLVSATLGTTLVDGNDAFGYALGVEAGQVIELNDGWSLTPQVQLAHSSVDFEDFTDRYGADVALEDGDRLVGRLGLSVDYETEWADEAGQVSKAHVYGIANVYYDFSDGSEVDVSGTRAVNENHPLSGGLGLGGSLSLDDGRVTVFGEASVRSTFEDIGDNYALGAKVGFNVKW